MQAFEIVESLEAYQENEKTNLAVDQYVLLLLFLAKKMQSYNRSIGFQISEPSESFPATMTAIPQNIKNLTNFDIPTEIAVNIEFATIEKNMQKGLLIIFDMVNTVIPILSEFAKKSSLSYNTELELPDYNMATLQVTFKKVLSNE
jgi:hypothetical protein